MGWRGAVSTLRKCFGKIRPPHDTENRRTASESHQRRVAAGNVLVLVESPPRVRARCGVLLGQLRQLEVALRVMQNGRTQGAGAGPGAEELRRAASPVELRHPSTARAPPSFAVRVRPRKKNPSCNSSKVVKTPVVGIRQVHTHV
jgi:hypothetical protein